MLDLESYVGIAGVIFFPTFSRIFRKLAERFLLQLSSFHSEVLITFYLSVLKGLGKLRQSAVGIIHIRFSVAFECDRFRRSHVKHRILPYVLQTALTSKNSRRFSSIFVPLTKSRPYLVFGDTFAPYIPCLSLTLE